MNKIKAALLASAVAIAPASAWAQAAVSTSYAPAFPTTINRGVVQFLQGTDTAGVYKTLYTAGAKGSRCWGMNMNNNDAGQTHVVTVQIVNTAVKYGGTALLTVVSAGFATAVPPQALMNSTVWPGLPIDNNGNPYINLINGDTIQVTFATALTSSDVINIQVYCGDYN